MNLYSHRSTAFAKELRASYLKRCATATSRDQLSTLLDGPSTGLLLSERLVNLPAALVPSLYDSLLQDIAWAVENAEDAAERASFRFSHLLVVAAVALAGAGGSSSHLAESEHDAHNSSAAGGKKRKRKAAATEQERAALLESIVFDRVEEEVLAAAAEWCTLLNGTGGRRQLVISLRPEQIKETLPALHAAMGES